LRLEEDRSEEGRYGQSRGMDDELEAFFVVCSWRYDGEGTSFKGVAIFTEPLAVMDGGIFRTGVLSEVGKWFISGIDSGELTS